MINKIPKNWQKVKLDDICDEIYRYPSFYGMEKVDDGVPVIRGEHLLDNGEISTNWSDYWFVRHDYSEQFPKTILKEGDLVIPVRGTLGKVSRVKKAHDGAQISPNLIRVSANRKKVNPLYLYYVIKSETTQKRLINRATASGVPILRGGDIKSLTLIIAPLKTQKCIASILSAFDDKIEVNNKIAKTLEQMAQAIFKEWFSNNKGQEYSVFDLAKYINGGAFGRIVNHNKKGLPLIKIAELNNGIRDRTEWIDKSVEEKYYIDNGDLLFSWSGSLELFIWDKGKAVLNQHIFNVKPKKGFSRGFLYFVLKSKLRYFQHLAGSKATTMGHIKKEHLREQIIFVSEGVNLKFFDTIYQKLIQLKLENQKLAAMRDLLLPKLMKGEIRA